MNEKQLLGRRIKELRKRLKLTQDVLAERSDLSPKYLSNIERGHENPTLDTLLRLARSLKVEPWELLVLDQDPQSAQALRGKIGRIAEQTDDPKQLRMILRLLQATLH